MHLRDDATLELSRSAPNWRKWCAHGARRRQCGPACPHRHAACAAHGTGLCRRRHDNVRHGTPTLFAALDVANGQVISRVRAQHRHQEFLDFLRQIGDLLHPEDRRRLRRGPVLLRGKRVERGRQGRVNCPRVAGRSNTWVREVATANSRDRRDSRRGCRRRCRRPRRLLALQHRRGRSRVRRPAGFEVHRQLGLPLRYARRCTPRWRTSATAVAPPRRCRARSPRPSRAPPAMRLASGISSERRREAGAGHPCAGGSRYPDGGRLERPSESNLASLSRHGAAAIHPFIRIPKENFVAHVLSTGGGKALIDPPTR